MPTMKELVEAEALRLGLPPRALDQLALGILAEVMQSCREWDHPDDIVRVFNTEMEELKS